MRPDGAAGRATCECLGRALWVKHETFGTHSRRVALARNRQPVPCRCAVRNEAVAVRLVVCGERTECAGGCRETGGCVVTASLKFAGGEQVNWSMQSC